LTIHFFDFAGPNLTISLFKHSMVNSQGNLVVIGGSSSGYYDSQSSFYQMSCYNGYCQWQEMKQKLKTPRRWFVAMTVPDSFADCCDTSVDPKCTKICKEDEVKCKTTFRCIKKSSLCDGTIDCDDYSDEFQASHNSKGLILKEGNCKQCLILLFSTL